VLWIRILIRINIRINLAVLDPDPDSGSANLKNYQINLVSCNLKGFCTFVLTPNVSMYIFHVKIQILFLYGLTRTRIRIGFAP